VQTPFVGTVPPVPHCAAVVHAPSVQVPVQSPPVPHCAPVSHVPAMHLRSMQTPRRKLLHAQIPRAGTVPHCASVVHAPDKH